MDPYSILAAGLGSYGLVEGLGVSMHAKKRYFFSNFVSSKNESFQVAASVLNVANTIIASDSKIATSLSISTSIAGQIPALTLGLVKPVFYWVGVLLHPDRNLVYMNKVRERDSDLGGRDTLSSGLLPFYIPSRVDIQSHFYHDKNEVCIPANEIFEEMRLHALAAFTNYNVFTTKMLLCNRTKVLPDGKYRYHEAAIEESSFDKEITISIDKMSSWSLKHIAYLFHLKIPYVYDERGQGSKGKHQVPSKLKDYIESKLKKGYKINLCVDESERDYLNKVLGYSSNDGKSSKLPDNLSFTNKAAQREEPIYLKGGVKAFISYSDDCNRVLFQKVGILDRIYNYLFGKTEESLLKASPKLCQHEKSIRMSGALMSAWKENHIQPLLEKVQIDLYDFQNNFDEKLTHKNKKARLHKVKSEYESDSFIKYLVRYFIEIKNVFLSTLFETYKEGQLSWFLLTLPAMLPKTIVNTVVSIVTIPFAYSQYMKEQALIDALSGDEIYNQSSAAKPAAKPPIIRRTNVLGIPIEIRHEKRKKHVIHKPKPK